ncbi:MAG: hypothetical protein NZ988_01960 [Thaumarchaeota archaeon]|nr:hypothetical protein [Candidatus Calditenuaceae archaeon]MDW8186801.1 hypothetical protein [Nitrososphaerota archaeon]
MGTRLHGRGLSIGLVTRDPVLASKVLSAGRSAGCSVLWVSSPDELPLHVDAVIVGSDASVSEHLRPTVKVGEEVSAECAVLRAIAASRSRGAPKLEVSVDPGRRMGLVVLLNGVVIASSVLVEVSELIEAVKDVVRCVRTDPSVIYVGSRPGPELRDLLSAIKSNFPSSEVTLVPEGPDIGAPLPEDLKGDALDAYVIYLRAISSAPEE